MASSAVVSAVAAMAAGAYLNAKLGIETDIKQLKADREWLSRLRQRINELGDTCSLYAIFDKVDPDLEALWFEGKGWTYGQVKEDANRLAMFLSGNGISKGDTVAMMTTNSPEMVICILALSRLGVIASLINTNLRGL